MAGVGFPQGEDVISGGINQSTPSQSSPTIRGREREREREEVEEEEKKADEEGERVEIWNEGKLSETTFPSLSGLYLGLAFSSSAVSSAFSSLLLLLSSSPPLHHREILRRRAAPRRGSQMNRFNEKMASQRGWEGQGRVTRGGSERKGRRRRKRVALVRSSETTAWVEAQMKLPL